MGRIVSAEYRSRQFLLEHLNWWQRFTYRRLGSFWVKGNHTRRHYRIDRRGVHRFPWFYCLTLIDYMGFVHSDSTEWRIPVPDQILAKKILIEADEKLFLATAIRR